MWSLFNFKTCTQLFNTPLLVKFTVSACELNTAAFLLLAASFPLIAAFLFASRIFPLLSVPSRFWFHAVLCS